MKLTKHEIKSQIKAGLIVGCLFLIFLLCGCATEKTWYADGQKKSHREGFVSWSDGDGKTIQMPLSHVSGIGK